MHTTPMFKADLELDAERLLCYRLGHTRVWDTSPGLLTKKWPVSVL